jgi:O-methyltransferase
MKFLRAIVKRAALSAGLDIRRRDVLAEQIPADYPRSEYLPPINRQSVMRLFYFQDMFHRAAAIAGDVVECGVSIGTGILNWALLSELTGIQRRIVGFDSFEGFPPSQELDRKADQTFHKQPGDYHSPPELVLRVLAEGRVSPEFVRNNVRLVRGFFDATLHTYDGRIALLHLDCDLYDSYKVCLESLYSKVMPGGLILFDEYEDPAFPGAKKAIDEFFAARPEKPTRYDAYGYVKFFIVKRTD